MNYTEKELKSLGIEVGKSLAVHNSVVFFNPQNLHIGDHTRIDCFSIISCGCDGIWIGDHCHIAAGCYLFGSGGQIRLEDFVGLSARVTIYTANDDYTEGWLTGPTVPDEYRKVRTGPVTLKKHAIVGAHSILLPQVTLGLGSSIGALTLVGNNVQAYNIVVGNPNRMVGKRGHRLLKLEKTLRLHRRC
jgi:galactoside O-acetyltransferase